MKYKDIPDNDAELSPKQIKELKEAEKNLLLEIREIKTNGDWLDFLWKRFQDIVIIHKRNNRYSMLQSHKGKILINHYNEILKSGKVHIRVYGNRITMVESRGI